MMIANIKVSMNRSLQNINNINLIKGHFKLLEESRTIRQVPCMDQRIQETKKIINLSPAKFNSMNIPGKYKKNSKITKIEIINMKNKSQNPKTKL